MIRLVFGFKIFVTRPKALAELTVRAEFASPCDEAALHERVAAEPEATTGDRFEAPSRQPVR